MTYRIEILTWITLDFIPFFVLFSIWAAIYSGNPTHTINGTSFENVIYYYLAAFFIQGITTVHFEGWRSEEIRLAKIDHFLVKPFSYLQELILGDLGSKLVYVLLFIPLFLLVLLFVLVHFAVPFPDVTATSITLLQLVPLIIAAYIVQLNIGIMITIATFWLEGSNGLEQFKNLALMLVTGSLMPLALMPNWLARLTELSPLRFLYATPIQVLLTGYHISPFEWLELLTLVVLSSWAVKKIWNQGTRKYTSAGGG